MVVKFGIIISDGWGNVIKKIIVGDTYPTEEQIKDIFTKARNEYNKNHYKPTMNIGKPMFAQVEKLWFPIDEVVN